MTPPTWPVAPTTATCMGPEATGHPARGRWIRRPAVQAMSATSHQWLGLVQPRRRIGTAPTCHDGRRWRHAGASVCS